jgi:hypothetical protein
MISLAESLLILWVAAAAAVLVYCSRIKRRERHLLIHLRESTQYARLYQKILYLIQHDDIDQLRIEQRGVTVTSVYPAHTLLSFDFKQNGNCKRSDVIPRLVTQLLQEDFPEIGREDVYKLSRYRVYRANGKMEYGFRFTMRRRYKDAVLMSKRSVQLRIL